MRSLPVAALLFCSSIALPEGTAPKPAAADYPAHVQAGPLSLGAEYTIHSFSGRRQTFIAKDYLVVEVALFVPPGQRLELSQGQFALRINGRMQSLAAQSPSFVAASLKYPDWETHPTLEAGDGLGNAGVMVGRPRQTERFPGDRRPSESRMPAPPQVPGQTGGIEKEPPPTAEEIVLETALPEGNLIPPVSGYLYFAYKGKVAGIRSLELIYLAPAGETTLKLR